MVLELKPEELNILDDLLSSEWRGKKPYVARPDKVKITAEQVRHVKRLYAIPYTIVKIMKITKLSEYYVRGVRRGRYDFLLESCDEPHRQPIR